MITIITSLYKSDRYLDVFSLKLKHFADFLLSRGVSFELIAIANEPTEREKKFAQEFEKNNWFKFVSIAREPLYATWNRGVGMAFGEIIGFWNVDDVRYPEAVLEGLKLFSGGAELVYFPFFLKRYLSLGFFDLPVITRRVEGKVLEFEKRKFETGMTAGPHFMFTKKVYEKVGGFDEQFKIAGDFDWCARAASLGANFKLGKEFSGVFRVDGHGLSSGANKLLQAENNIVYKRQKADEKVILGIEILESKYRLKERLFGSKWLSVF